MATINKSQIQRVYALGASIGILESGNKEDDLHALVFSLTKKASISGLSEAEFKTVERELQERMRYGNRTAPLKTRTNTRKTETDTDEVPGMMNKAQQKKAWKLIYELCELDKRQKTPGERMCGAIRTILEIDARVEEPFRWINFQDGGKLIEHLKRYVKSAEKKQQVAV